MHATQHKHSTHRHKRDHGMPNAHRASAPTCDEAHATSRTRAPAASPATGDGQDAEDEGDVIDSVDDYVFELLDGTKGTHTLQASTLHTHGTPPPPP